MFIAAYGDWGTVWDVFTVPVTDNDMFNYFFTLVLLFGIISWMCGLLFKLITRS
jgi:hypothetical protein